MSKRVVLESELGHHKRRLLSDSELHHTSTFDTSDDDFILTDSNIGMHQMNFDEAIRMATDNKINTANSWDYALIDYFHDMNLLRSKDGVSINFQKAGATLDGCMKIFSHRIDSVATDTGRLLSGLEDKRTNSDKSNNSEKEKASGDDNNEEEGDTQKQTSRNKGKHRLTLLKDFSPLKLRQYERELNIDPLFKRALSEFDEGGAKSLLMNILGVDATGRIAFDEATTRQYDSAHIINSNSDENLKTSYNSETPYVKPNELLVINDLNIYQVCPSLEALKNALQNVDMVNSFVDSVLQTNTEENYVESSPMNEDVDEFNDIESDLNEREGSIRSMTETADTSISADDIGKSVSKETISLIETVVSDKVLVPGQSLNSWKIGLFKNTMGKNIKHESDTKVGDIIVKDENTPMLEEKKVAKMNHQINFLEDQKSDPSEKRLFHKGKRISFPETHFSFASELTLPEDYSWNVKKMVMLFLKPDSNIKVFKYKSKRNNVLNEDIDTDNEEGDDNRFFDDDVQKDIAGPIETKEEEEDGILRDIDFNAQFGSQDFDDEADKHLSYSRVSKKVDIRLLKEKMWSMTLSMAKDKAIDLSFMDIVEKTLATYGAKEKMDISTSYLFICMLHLANEHGLNLSDSEGYLNLQITGKLE